MQFEPLMQQVVEYGLLLGLLGSSISLVLGYFVKSILNTFTLIAK